MSAISHRSTHEQVPTWPSPRPRLQQPRQPLWLALNAVLGLMDTEAMLHVLDLCPELLDIAVNCARSGSPASWPAVGCLKTMFASAAHQVSQKAAEDCQRGHALSLLAGSLLRGRGLGQKLSAACQKLCLRTRPHNQLHE